MNTNMNTQMNTQMNGSTIWRADELKDDNYDESLRHSVIMPLP